MKYVQDREPRQSSTRSSPIRDLPIDRTSTRSIDYRLSSSNEASSIEKKLREGHPITMEVNGATLDEIVTYVMQESKITYNEARYAVLKVLDLGIAMKRIKRNPIGLYYLILAKPATLTMKIREPRFSDDSSSESRSDTSFD
ncbi:uncharacterized protein LOC107269167 isoform X2 [Cephus cinctus]|uniref:Uncharacterized protein LOC107269167 isoform X2 n=1 Tax=Cephus cinctus TaxID=211228 RepID=A0AAJ7RJR1_CEPCN|nr:uncharacterized protein LOC107269167 isoform X2 [Cephus cinctus]